MVNPEIDVERLRSLLARWRVLARHRVRDGRSQAVLFGCAAELEAALDGRLPVLPVEARLP